MAFKFLLLSNSVNELHDCWDEYGKAPVMTLHGGKTVRDYFVTASPLYAFIFLEYI
jgi:hypothetical protein